MTTVGLAMIVRDAEDTLPACLEAARPLLSHWTVIDTGSTDRTKDVVREQLGDLPGNLHLSDWQNFAHNRTELMQKAKGTADYLLLLDADMILHLDRPLPELTADIYEGRIQGSIDYTLPFLVRGDRDWAYHGVAHAYLGAVDGLGTTEEVLDGLEIEDHSHTTVDKLLRDLDVLSAEHARNPTDPRTAFYLAQTYYDLDRFDEAIQMYRTRAYMTNGWDEETFFARYRLGVLLCEHRSFLEGAQELLKAWESRPQRIEPLRVLANVANSVADKYPLPDDRLFIVRRHYVQPALKVEDVSAVIVTRGNVDLAPILATLPYPEIVIWDNSKRQDMKTFGRYCALNEVSNDVVYFQDDDVLFTAHDALLREWEPGMAVANMDRSWVDACGYHDMIMTGAGSLVPRDMPGPLFAAYLAEHDFDDEFLLESDFVFGTLAWPYAKVVDLGYDTFDYADANDRLYTQPWQPALKAKVREQARRVLAGMEAVAA